MISITSLLLILIAILTIILGAFVIVRPTAIYNFTGLSANGIRGITEIRAIFGGLFVALGAAPLMLNTPAAYKMLGIVYIGIAVTRIGSMVNEPCFEKSNLISLFSELLFGALLLLL
jgi:hypothetical protein